MTEIKLHNSIARQKQKFVPIDANNVRMYLCGPTVYDRAHIGNARNVIMFDVLFRLMLKVYGEKHVTYVRNFTDVDDKINERAAATNRTIGEVTQETTQWYLDDMAALGNLEPTHMPKATQYIAEMIEIIETLIKGGNAYEAQGHVLFSVDSYKEYGHLSGRSVDDMIAGARVEVAPYKRDAMDFVLWKPSEPSLPGWNSPWGRGRPGWHIECSAMSHALLGESFDIHGGGNDLMFPHHENEIAQSKCAHPKGDFAHYWLHNEMLQVEGKKMSKSLGNFFTVRDLINQGYAGEVIRFVFLSTHYGKPMDWTDAKAKEAENTLRRWRRIVSDVSVNVSPSQKAIDILADDLNTAGVIAHLHSLAQSGDGAALKADAALIGLLCDNMGKWAEDVDLSQFEEKLWHTRQDALKTKDFSQVDLLKSQFAEAGLDVRMSKEKVELVPKAGFDMEKIKRLL